MFRITLAALGVACFLCTFAWAADSPVVNYLRKPSRPANWAFGISGSALASISQEPDGAISATVTRASDEAWHVQLFQSHLPLQEGIRYTIKFRAKSDAPRTYTCAVGTDVPDWHNVSPTFDVPTTTQYQQFRFEFIATKVVPDSSRGPQFFLGKTPGTLYLADVALEGPPLPKPALPAGFAEFPMQWNDTASGTAIDVSFLNTGPADDRIIVRDGHFAGERSGKRIRFFGTNLAGAQAFPDKEDARLIARRLAMAGINIVRLHALDNSWGADKSLWDSARPGHQFSPRQLDKLDFLISQLKANGIYVNLNLKVCKVLTPADGMPESVTKIPFDYQKRVDMFDRRMIDLQKQYACDLLSHRNAYTRLTYQQDSVIACIEANNENSLVSLWDPALGMRLETLPDPFKAELGQLWSKWLKHKYSSDDQLAAVWLKGTTPPGESILGPELQWQPEMHEAAQMVFTPAKALGSGSAPGFTVDIRAVDGIDWHLQNHITGLTVKEGDTYTVTFRAKADALRKMPVVLNKDIEDWHSMGLYATADLDTQWRDYAFCFTAHNTTPGHARLGFVFGEQAGSVSVENLQLAPGARLAGLQPGESLDKANLSVPVTFTPAQRADWIAFLVYTEKAYADEMRQVVKDELKAHALFAITQIEYGGIAGMIREHDMDYTDAHAYWQHPAFPKTPWDPVNWRIQNTPEVTALGEDELAHLAYRRIAGRPFSISEYDHPAPSDYACEMIPTYATLACLQDWDAIYTFAMDDYIANDPDQIRGYFEQASHPAKWCLYPFAALVFRQGLIAPAAAASVLQLPSSPWQFSESTYDAWRAAAPGGTSIFTQRLAVANDLLASEKQARIVRTGTPAPTQISLNSAPGGNVYIAAAPSAVAFVGYIGATTQTAGDVLLKTDAFGNNFAAVTAVATDHQPLTQSRRILISVVGRAENQAMGWNADRTTIGSQWGRGPTIVQFIPAQLSLCTAGALKAYALDSTGKRVKPATASFANGTLILTTQPGDATVLYELAEN